MPESVRLSGLVAGDHSRADTHRPACNSGVFLHDRYEVQVLDSYQSQTYPNGQAAAVFGQLPPLVNASRAPGLWQTYDIVFHGPRFWIRELPENH